MNLSKFSWKASLALLLAAFFLMSSISNIVATGQIAADYSRWDTQTGSTTSPVCLNSRQRYCSQYARFVSGVQR